MSSGTKITLAVIALFVGVIVVYYGFLMPEREPDGPRIEDPIAKSDAKPAAEDPNDIETSRSSARWTPRPTAVRPEPPSERLDEETIAAPPPLPTDEPTLGMLSDEPGSVTPTANDPLSEAMNDAAPASADETVPPRGDSTQRNDAGTGERAPTTTPPQPTRPRAERATSDSSAATSSRPQPNRPVSLTRSQPPVMTDYVVQEGDTLYSIAEGWFGDASRWGLITEANPDLDPRRLQIGQRLKLPPKDARRANGVAGDGPQIYVVRSGDTLSSIAKSAYKEERLWRRIYLANRTAIGPNPDELTVGMKLSIPPKP
jgi:nucleoid-associated protein YgaU